MRRTTSGARGLVLALSACFLTTVGAPSDAQQPKATAKKPNILVMFGDDIGQSNISTYTMGLMGYRTPNIDSIAKAGMIFSDYYAEQSCTAGRSTFITGQVTLRTGLSKVGVPGSPVGLQKEDATIAEVLKPMGYATGQFGKNHLGDRDDYLPTAHGFDEFFGNLYHLNAEEEPEQRTYPTDPEFKKRFGPRGVVHSFADGKIEDTGPLTKKRMETIDDETSAAAMDFIERQHKAGKPFFCWFNSTRMHFRTHVRAEHRSKPGLTSLMEYADGMIEHDATIGHILKKVADLGIADDTIVIYTTDNGPHMNSWPDAAMTPFRNEKNSNWEGAFRVPAMIRWPGHVQPGSVSNEIVSGLDWFPTLVAAAGDADIAAKLLKGHSAGAKTFKNHLDGYNILPYLTGQADRTPHCQALRSNALRLSTSTTNQAFSMESLVEWKTVDVQSVDACGDTSLISAQDNGHQYQDSPAYGESYQQYPENRFHGVGGERRHVHSLLVTKAFTPPVRAFNRGERGRFQHPFKRLNAFVGWAKPTGSGSETRWSDVGDAPTLHADPNPQTRQSIFNPGSGL